MPQAPVVNTALNSTSPKLAGDFWDLASCLTCPSFDPEFPSLLEGSEPDETGFGSCVDRDNTKSLSILKIRTF